MSKVRFRITAARVDKIQVFLFKYLNALTSFNRIMSYEEKIVVYELRTKILQQAVNNFTSVTHFLA